MRASALTIFLLMLALCAWGLIFVASSSSYISLQDTGDAFYMLKRQLLWFAFSLVVFFLLQIGVRSEAKQIGSGRFPRASFFEQWATVIFVLSLGAMVLLETPLAVSTYGSTRWIALGPITVQPSEFLKLATVIFFSAVLTRIVDWNLKTWNWLFLLGISILPVIAVALEPDLGSAILIALTLITVFAISGVDWRKIFAALGIIVAGGVVLTFVYPYMLQRLIDFIQGGTHYNIRQSLYSYGAGGIWGVGFGLSQQKFQWLPMAHNDFIFAIIAEETGLWGVAITLGLFLALIIVGLDLALHCRSLFNRLMAGGLSAMIGFQALVHIGVTAGVVPATGLTLPFISTGGTSLLVSICACGLLVRIARLEAVKA